ncbi:MAG: DUF4300 family protein [Lachnospiraceae bacterium]|nr:DUF4300 family protein [Lachnospiraceae bacterium]
MRRIKPFLGALLLGVCLLLAACGDQKEGKEAKQKTASFAESSQGEEQKETSAVIPIMYSNLVDEETRNRVSAALKNAGLKDEKITAFFLAVDEYNNAVGKENLVQKMTTTDGPFPSMDSDRLIDLWLQNGGFVGRNCRITSFSLMGDFITVKKPAAGDTTMLFSDFEAIGAKHLFQGEERKKFDTLFSYIDVTNTHDTKELAKEIIASWKKKGISFHNDKMHMLSVFMTMDDGKNRVQEFIGHTGILLEDGDHYLFVEKLAFELPYQVEEFRSRQEVNDYLMACYDKDADGLTAKPVIFEDDQVMKEYRVLK